LSAATTILSIDQSTSATKAVLYDALGRALAKASREHQQHYPKPGWVEHDAEEIWRNVVAVIGALVASHPREIAAAACLSITNQRETCVAFDRATGKPLHHAIVWQCRRGEPICAKWSAAGHGDRVRTKTGLRIDPYFSASKLAWLVRERPDVAAKLRDGTGVAGTIDAYLVHRLTGGTVTATDHTNASRTMLFDIGRLAWDEGLCDLAGVPPRSLPEVRDSSAGFGETDVGGVLPRKIPIRGVIGDSQASLFAHRCFAAGQTKATLGTGTSIMTTVGPARPRDGDGTVAAVAWTYAGTPTYAVEGIIHSSAATIEWLRTQLGLFASAAECESLANSVPDNGGVYLVPAFGGLGAPHWSTSARAAIVGLSAHSTKAHVARAAVESIAFQIADVLDVIAAETGTRPTALRVDGGAAKNAALVQLIADLTGLPLSVATMPDGSSLGAAMLGALGCGLAGSMDELARWPADHAEVSPAMSRDRAGQLRAAWSKAVGQVLAGA
jgi:glycerol kinase